MADGTSIPTNGYPIDHAAWERDRAGSPSSDKPAGGISYVRGFGDPEPIEGHVHEDADHRDGDRFSYARAASGRETFRG
jgi:hypothetical protein